MHALLTKSSDNSRVRKNLPPSASMSRHPITPFSDNNLGLQRKASCACGGGCPACQAKSSDLNVSQPDDPTEIEADQIADTVMRMPVGEGKPALREGREANTLHRKASEDSASPQSVPGIFGLHGRPLDVGTREFFEPRFGRDLGDIRIHTGNETNNTAQNISARAYTLGSNIGFATGSYDPVSHEGRRLIAHELAHVVQQQNETAPGIVHRDFVPWPGQTGTDAKDAAGKSTYKEEGDVVSEYVQRTGDERFTAPKPALLEFDKKNCTVSATVEVHFTKSADPKKPVSDDDLNKVKEIFFKIANEKLNGWVEVTVGAGEKCTVCAGKTVPVKIVAKEGSGPFADSVEVVKSINREDAGHLAVGTSDSTVWHEAGHIVLGAADEYQEANRSVRKDPRPEDKVHPGDYSVMEDSAMRHAMMHARHFSHIPAWLGRKFPGCVFELSERSAPLGVDVRAPLIFLYPTGGYANIGGSHGAFLNYGLNIGIPLTNARDWELFVGAHGTFMGQLEGDKRLAFLLGARVGIEKLWTPGAGGFNAGGFVEGGAAFVGDTSSKDAPTSYLPGGYGYGGINLGYKLSPSILNMSFNAEIGGGVMGAPGLHDPQTFIKDEKLLPFFTAGLRATMML